jgi:hypothetical protein
MMIANFHTTPGQTGKVRSANITMLGKLSFFYVLSIISLTSLVVIRYNSGLTNYVPDAQKDKGGNEKVSMK